MIVAVGYWVVNNLDQIEKVIPKKTDRASPNPKKEVPQIAPKKVVVAKVAPKKAVLPAKPPAPKVIRITATRENAIALAKQRCELASEIFREERFERTENAAVNLTTALQLVTESGKILSKLGQLENFADRTLARHIIELKKDCQERLKQLEEFGIKAPKTATSNAIIEIVEKPAPTRANLKPVIANKSGFGGSNVYNAKFTLENKLPQSTHIESIQVVFYDAFDLEIGRVAADGAKEINPGSRNQYTARYLGNDASKIKTFKVLFD